MTDAFAMTNSKKEKYDRAVLEEEIRKSLKGGEIENKKIEEILDRKPSMYFFAPDAWKYVNDDKLEYAKRAVQVNPACIEAVLPWKRRKILKYMKEQNIEYTPIPSVKKTKKN